MPTQQDAPGVAPERAEEKVQESAVAAPTRPAQFAIVRGWGANVLSIGVAETPARVMEIWHAMTQGRYADEEDPLAAYYADEDGPHVRGLYTEVIRLWPADLAASYYERYDMSRNRVGSLAQLHELAG